MRLSAADCICISGFWLRPQTPTGALPLDPAGGLPSPRPPVPTLPPNPGYATVRETCVLCPLDGTKVYLFPLLRKCLAMRALSDSDKV